MSQLETLRQPGKEKKIFHASPDNLKRQSRLLSFPLVLGLQEYKPVHEEITEFVNKLKQKYPDWNDYRIIHILAGSTIPPDEKKNEADLPGKDSAEAFITYLE